MLIMENPAESKLENESTTTFISGCIGTEALERGIHLNTLIYKVLGELILDHIQAGTCLLRADATA